MEPQKDIQQLLDLNLRPAFCVRDHRITAVNQAAESLLICTGTDIRDLLLTGAEEYSSFQQGCMYLKLNLTSAGCGAAVVRMDGQDIFILDQESDDSALKAISLAAMELRRPLATVMSTAEYLVNAACNADPKADAYAAQMNRGLHQILRMVCNMADASSSLSRQETRNIGKVFQEIMEKAASLVGCTGLRLTWEGLKEEVYTPVDYDQLERAIWNLLSNAIKFTPKDGSIHVSLTRRGRILRLSVQDSGSAIEQHIRSTIFSRYLRQPGIEDSRHGIGLGMVLIRAAAASHGGTVLIDQPDEIGTRITMTMMIRQKRDATLRSPLQHVDYAGGRDRGLLELSDCLSASVYQP